MATSRTLTISAFAARRMPDENIFAGTLRGDPVAFSEVYRRYHKRVYGYCLARSLDPHTAADATQEVFMRLLRAEPGSIDKPRSWLFTVARNVSVDTIRRRSRVEPVETMDGEEVALGVATPEDPADVVLSKADGRDAFLALRQLNPRYRTALILREVHGQSSRDIGEALSATPGAVDTLVSRARDAFGTAYAGVLDLPAACRANVELIYRRLGSGITEVEQQALDSHLATCDKCRREAKKAGTPGRLAALLPFLLPARSFGRGLLARAAAIRQSVPDAVVQQATTVASQPHAVSVGAKVAAGLVAALLIAAPVAGTLAARRTSAARQGSVAAKSATPSTRTSGSTTAAPSVGGRAVPEHVAATSSMHHSTSGSHATDTTHHSSTTIASGTHDTHSTASSTSGMQTPQPQHHSGSTSSDGMTSDHTEPAHH